MTSRSTPPDRPLRAKLRELGLLSRGQEAGLPQFLILAAECPGARSLAQLLQRHPGCALPDALGTRFFSSRHRWCDLDWYVRTLGNDVHLVRGEWTPSYALVPVKTIRLIQELLPQLKLVFLLRDPAVEAWHAWQQLQQTAPVSGAVSGAWLDSWPWARADVLGQLRRWRSVFPADQFFIGFDEQYRTEQRTFLTGLCDFLDVDSSLPEQRVDPGPVFPREIPAEELSLMREVCRSRLEELVAFLRNDFGQNVPTCWTAPPATNLDSDRVAQLARAFSTAVKHEFDDVFLFRAVECDEGNSRGSKPSSTVPKRTPQNSDFQSAGFASEKLPVRGDVLPRLVQEGYCGYNIVAFKQVFIALPLAAGAIDLTRMSDAELERRVNANEFLRARSRASSEQAIDEYLAAVEAVRNSSSTPHGADELPQAAA